MNKITDLTPHLLPSVAKALEAAPATYPREDLDFNKYRKMMEMPPTPAPDDVSISDMTVPGYREEDPDVPVRVYTPADAPAKDTLVWIHGGGFVVGGLNDDDPRCIQWTRKAKCNVVSVDYRLAPEHTFPAATNDCYAALLWTAAGPEVLGGKQQQIAIGGASAGGCHAAAVALMARDLDGPTLCYQLLLVPVLDDRHETRSSQVIHDPRVWNREKSISCWKLYLGKDHSGDVSYYASPARAEDLSGLPPASIFVAEMDLLRDEAVDYANRLTASDIRTNLSVYAGTCHGAMDPNSDIARRMARDVLDAVKLSFGKPALG